MPKYFGFLLGKNPHTYNDSELFWMIFNYCANLILPFSWKLYQLYYVTYILDGCNGGCEETRFFFSESGSGSLLFLLLHHQSFKFWWWLSRYFFFCTRFFPGCKSIITSGLLLLISTSSLFCPPFSQAIFQMRFICFKSQGNWKNCSFSQN